LNSTTDNSSGNSGGKFSGGAGARFSDWEYRNIALAAVAQCAQLVHALAFTGRADQRQIDACIAPLLILNPATTADVYPDVGRFVSGLDFLQKSLTSSGAREYGEPIKYVLGMTVLQQQLMKVPAMQALIRRRLPLLPLYQGTEQNNIREEIEEVCADAGNQALGESLASTLASNPASQFNLAALATLYQDTISKLTFRIHVKGNIEFLKDPRVAENIRALLLAGIRSSLLWHQLGGRRWHLIVYKKSIRDCVSQVRRKLMTIH
jgi:high frequency lysogenization protein